MGSDRVRCRVASPINDEKNIFIVRLQNEFTVSGRLPIYKKRARASSTLMAKVKVVVVVVSGGTPPKETEKVANAERQTGKSKFLR